MSFVKLTDFKWVEISDILHHVTATAAFHNLDECSNPPKCHLNTCLVVLTKIMKWIKWEEDLKTWMHLLCPCRSWKSVIAQRAPIAKMCEEEMIHIAGELLFLKE